ncbi:MAG: hypothetical protein JXB39_14470 [Deltaproteobacteria bacterium]|nr:hypothetical protein [Deltaproteobacteria bacterium]
MTLQDALAALLVSLFDRSELRTLASTDLFLGDLAADLPPEGASLADTAASVVAGLKKRHLLNRSLFRTLTTLRPSHSRAIRLMEARWTSRRVVLLYDTGSGTGGTPPDVAVARTLAWALTERGHCVWSVPPTADHAGSWAEREIHDTCDAVLLILSASAARSGPLQAAARSALARRLAGSRLPALMVAALDPTPPEGDLLPLMADAKLYTADGSPDALVDSLDRDLRHLAPVASQPVDCERTAWGWPRMAPVQESRPPGPVPRIEAFARGCRPPEAAFAMEILPRAPTVEVSGDRLAVTVDRVGVKEAVHTGAARNALWASWLGVREKREAAQAWDAWYQARLTGGDPGPPPEWPPVPLRWAAGGILPLVRWRNRTWVPLFFRDIPPYGWVLPMGATDPEDDLQDPAAFALREALEELMILRGEPRRGVPLALRLLIVDDGEGPEAARARAVAALSAPVALRLQRDGLALGDGPVPSVHDPAPPPLLADPVPTRTDLEILGPDGVPRRHPDVLVSLGPLDLGIDVIRVLRLDLDAEDTILDGEVLVRPDGTRELVRMPVAMIAWSAISRVFPARGRHTLAWTQDTPPSVRAGPLGPADVHFFGWDIVRRREIALGSRMGDAPDPRDRARCRTWIEQFGPRFLDAGGQPSTASPCDLWVPATARVLAQAVARRVGP